MSVNSSRREAYIATILALGFFGVALAVASEILKYEVGELWDACKGKRRKSFGPYLSLGAIIPIVLSTILGLLHSMKSVKVAFTGRLFCWGNRRRGYRAHLVSSFILGWCFCGAGCYVLQQHARADLENQRCKGSLESMQDYYTELQEGLYAVGGVLGFLGSACAAIFFLIIDRRKRRKLRMKRYHSSRFYDTSGTDGEDTADEGLGTHNPMYTRKYSSRRHRYR